MKKYGLHFQPNYFAPMDKIKKALVDYDIIDMKVSGDTVSCDVEWCLSDKKQVKDERAVHFIQSLKTENKRLTQLSEKNETHNEILTKEITEMKRVLKEYEKDAKVKKKVNIDGILSNCKMPPVETYILIETIELLKKHKIKQKELAARCKLSNATISNMFHSGAGSVERHAVVLEIVNIMIKEKEEQDA